MRYFSSYLIYARAGRPTGKNIARTLGVERCGIRIPDFPPDILVRWGSRKEIPWPIAIEINPVEGISNSSDKIRAFQKFGLAGVNTPPVYREWHDAARYAREYLGRESFILGRKRSGMQGRDIVVYDINGTYGGQYPKKPAADHTHDFFTPWISSRREVRIHVCDGHVIRVQGKYADHPDMQANPFVRNYANGYRFRTPKQELHRSRKKAAIAAVEALGLHFGAVDMLLTGENGGTVLEVNTAPSCSPLTARCYTAAIALLIERLSGGEAHFAREIMESEVELDYDEEYVEEKETYLE